MVGYALHGYSAQSCSWLIEDESFAIDLPYQHFLNTRNERIHSFVHLQGEAREKSQAGSQFTLFTAAMEKGQDFITKLIEAEADVICLEGLASHEEGYSCYIALKGLYACFYVETCDTGIALVASKYKIENPFYAYFENGEGLFDFEIVGVDHVIGHIYLSTLGSEGNDTLYQAILGKMESDYSNSKELAPFVLCGNLGNISAPSLNFEFATDALGLQSVLLFQPMGVLYGQYCLEKQMSWEQGMLVVIQYGFSFENNWAGILGGGATLLCEDNAPATQAPEQNQTPSLPPAPKNRVEVQGQHRTDGRSSATLQYSRSAKNADGSSSQVGVGIGAERNSSGEASGEVKVFGAYEW